MKYEFAKTIVIDEGFQEEIFWQSRLNFNDLDEPSFLREIAWVILTCGMKESIIRDRFNSISECFYNWSSAKIIVLNQELCKNNALKIFNNNAKILAIISSAIKIEKIGFSWYKQKIKKNPLSSSPRF